MHFISKTVRSFYKNFIHFKSVRRKYSCSENVIIMGIESSCDDTGCALVDSNGNILGEALHSQHLTHLK